MAPSLDPPNFLGRYELMHRIGAGGMGEIFLARLPGLSGIDKVLVVKKILPHLADDRQFIGRFLDEAKVVVHLTHGNIAQVFEMGEADGEYFMAMEYVEGRTLGKVSARLRERGKRLQLDLALYLGARICDGLAYAHRKVDPAGRPLYVVHRDLSPSNVIVSFEGEVKIVDFGASKHVDKEEKTSPRVVIGSLAYMAPEQARKQIVDHRADVFSLGVVLWELAAWKQVYTGGDLVERWRRAANPKFEAPSTFNPEVPKELDAVILKALSPNPAERHQTAEELRDGLMHALSALGNGPSQSTLSQLVGDLFARERDQERAVVAEALRRPASRERAPASGRPANTARAAPLHLLEKQKKRSLSEEIRIGLGEKEEMEELGRPPRAPLPPPPVPVESTGPKPQFVDDDDDEPTIPSGKMERPARLRYLLPTLAVAGGVIAGLILAGLLLRR